MPDEPRVADPLAGYADWPAFMARAGGLTGDACTQHWAALLGVPAPAPPSAVAVLDRWEADGVRTSMLEWEVGFGPRLQAWLLRPTDADPHRLPGVLALHSHGGLKRVGAARMVQLPRDLAGDPDPRSQAYRESAEEGRFFATDLARQGLVVLASDAFSWGSRRFPLEPMPGTAAGYEALARVHEHQLAKLCQLNRTSYPGMVAHDDLSSLAVLRRHCGGPLGVVGFSGGGGRAAAVTALNPHVEAAVVAGMMASLPLLPPRQFVEHSWLLHAPGLARCGDLPGLAAARRAHQLLVVQGRHDPLFEDASMEAADAMLVELFDGAPGSYRRLWLEAGHVFPGAAHQAAADFLIEVLDRR